MKILLRLSISDIVTITDVLSLIHFYDKNFLYVTFVSKTFRAYLKYLYTLKILVTINGKKKKASFLISDILLFSSLQRTATNKQGDGDLGWNQTPC